MSQIVNVFNIFVKICVIVTVTQYQNAPHERQTSKIHCLSSIFETANQYVSIARTTHVCMLDASTAFDWVNYFLTPFKKWQCRFMCLLFLRFLIHSYCNKKMRVKWNGALSRTFSYSNGVKQGVVLSPLLFTV